MRLCVRDTSGAYCSGVCDSRGCGFPGALEDPPHQRSRQPQTADAADGEVRLVCVFGVVGDSAPHSSDFQLDEALDPNGVGHRPS